MNYLIRSFFERDTVQVARELLGKVMVRRFGDAVCCARIVETESYTSDDPACHAFRGKTKRNASLFGPVGHAYVYLSYGLHWCLNVVARKPSMSAGGVLIRALEPMSGIEFFRNNRPWVKYSDLMNGPGKVTKALMIDRSYDGYDLIANNELTFMDSDIPNNYEVQTTTRIGINKAIDQPWRFLLIKSN